MFNMLNWEQANWLLELHFVKSLNMFSAVELNLFELHVTVSENLKVDALSSTHIIMKPL